MEETDAEETDTGRTEAEYADTETDKIRDIYPDAETQYTGGDLSLWHRPAR